MKLERIDVFRFEYALAEAPFVMSGGKVTISQDSTIVRLVTNDGRVGWASTAR